MNVTATRVRYRGRDAIELVGRPGVTTPGTPVNNIAIVDYEFQDGTIEADIAGTPAAGADTSARGFVGIAGRIALWIEAGTEAHFSRLRVTPAAATRPRIPSRAPLRHERFARNDLDAVRRSRR